MIKLSISSKILIYFLVVALLPLTAASLILVASAHTQLLQAASAKQQAIANGLVDRVNNYLADKINGLVYQSQAYSAGNLSPTEINQNLAVLFHQDPDLQRVALLSADGGEQVVFDKQGQVHNLGNEASTDAFKAVTFLSGKNYVGSVSYNKQHSPQITIAVPILKSDFARDLNDLSKANFGTYNSPGDFQGAIVADYNISDLWQSVLSTKIGSGGYAYVVDGFGNLVAYPNSRFLATHQELSNVQAVKEFIDGSTATRKTTSEIGQAVISTPRITSYSSWAVIVEEPVSSIYAGINAYIKLATTIGVSAIVLSILMSIFFRKQLTGPLKKLTLGAKRLGAGDFDQTIKLKSKDELQELANTFNKMGLDIKKLVNDLRANNVNLTIEQTKLNNIISSVSDGVIALDSKGQIVSINPPAARLVDAKPTELRGKPMADLFRWEQNGNKFKPELKKPGLYHYSDLLLINSGKIYYLDLMVSVIDSLASDVAAIITIHDLTQSRELDFMKLDFVAIAAHELRTPLTVVKGYLDMINNNVIKSLTIFDIENLQKAILGTNQLRDLINKLLNIARIERGEIELFIEKLDLTRTVHDNVNQHKATAAQKNQKIFYKTNADKPVFVPADASSINEVMNNLIGNALKFSAAGSVVHVNLLADNDMVKVEVADNGPGVPPEFRARLFTKFYRAERSLISGNRGTGLGLYISKTIIELQHGTIGIEPDSIKGSTFYFTLPVYKPEEHDKLLNKEKQTGEIRGWFKKRSGSRR